jgi:hypothetical protein
MEVKDAVKEAKSYILNLLEDEGIFNLGLEEVDFNDAERVWDVTLGFSRPWNSVRGPLSTITGESSPKRAYRVVRVRDNDRKVLSVRKQRSLIDESVSGSA